MITARSIGLYERTIPRPANCDHSFHHLLPNATDFPAKRPGKFLYATACIFFGNSKQLQQRDSVHLSSVYTDYSFSSFWL